jgi:magnesium-protoporphyrin O-methyltransferase
MPTSTTYQRRRGQLLEYFDRTAAQAWSRLTSDAPVSGIRATVREGRRRMFENVLSCMPDDLRGLKVLDAGCGTGTLSVEMAKRGAQVTAIDIAPTLVGFARERFEGHVFESGGTIDFRVGDLSDASLGHFDYVVALDSLIHYRAPDMVRVLTDLSPRVCKGICFTFAPRTPLLWVFWISGRLFPRSDRAPAIEPVTEHRLRKLISKNTTMSAFKIGKSLRVGHFFYTSHALQLVHQ